MANQDLVQSEKQSDISLEQRQVENSILPPSERTNPPEPKPKSEPKVKMPSNSLEHWNGNQLCAIDCETTGLDPYIHEIIQLCILPLDLHMRPRKDVLPFNIYLKPESPELATREAMKVNKIDLTHLARFGHHPNAAEDLLLSWLDKLQLGYNSWGNRYKIIPLAHNWVFDRSFIMRWLGVEAFNDIFHYHYADTMAAAQFLNDHTAVHGDSVPFSKVKLSWVAKKLGITHGKAHDALADCITTAEVYRKLTHSGVMSFEV